MEYGIQRRGIFLRPPTDADLEWLCLLFDEREIWEMFGMEGPARWKIMRLFRDGNIVVGILHTVEPIKRIGFVVMFPPDEGRNFWEFGYAIPDPADRDGFSALASTDAMAHYMFEHLNVEAMGWRTRADNRAAAAVVKRLGYEPFEDRVLGGHTYTFYRLDRAGWEKRRAKLDRGEAEHPSGLGATFVTLPEYPFEPVIPAKIAEEVSVSPAVEPAAARSPQAKRRRAPQKKRRA